MHLLIPAAGSGKRMGAGVNKVLLPLAGRPVLAWTLAAAAQSASIEWIGLIGQPEDGAIFESLLRQFPVSKPVEILVGGSTRQESVFAGIRHLYAQDQIKQVLIHDGARCLATPHLFDRCSQALDHASGIIAAIPVKDTIKVVRETTEQGIRHRWVESTPDRQLLWAAQTPQGFDLALLHQAHQKAIDCGWEVTDDAALFEKLEFPVVIVEGEETNLKLTTPADLGLAEQILAQRLGHGISIHGN